MNKASAPKQGEAAGRNSGPRSKGKRQAETREFLPVNRGKRGKTRESRPKTAVNGMKLGSFCPSTVVNGAKLGKVARKPW